jgi:hypothetical protein
MCPMACVQQFQAREGRIRTRDDARRVPTRPKDTEGPDVTGRGEEVHRAVVELNERLRKLAAAK